MSTEPIEPIPETVRTRNIPYRGSQDHGVPIENQFPEMPDWDETGEAPEFVEEDEQPDPIPVRIVGGDAPKEFVDWRVGTSYVGQVGQPLIPRNDSRLWVRVKNLGSDDIYFGPGSNVNSVAGYTLSPGETSPDLRTTRDIWFKTDSATLQAIAYIFEYRVEIS